MRLGVEGMMAAMGPTSDGGAVDALLVEFDEDTGEAMPGFTHDGLSRVVRETVAGWSSDKAHGQHAYAYTAAVSDTLFEVEVDARGMRRATTRAPMTMIDDRRWGGRCRDEPQLCMQMSMRVRCT